MTVSPVVPAALLLLLLTGCVPESTGAADPSDPATAQSDGATDGSPDSSSPSAEPVAAPDCEGVRVGFEEYAASLGAGMGFGFADPQDIVGVSKLPAEVLALGCYIQDPLNENSAWALIVDPDGSVYDQLSVILAVDHTATEVDGINVTWDSDADSVTLSGGITVDNAAQAHLTEDIVAAFNGATITSNVVSAYL